MLIVKLLHVVFIHGQVRTHFLPNHALRDDLVAQVLLEVFIRSSLRLSRLLQFFHAATENNAPAVNEDDIGQNLLDLVHLVCGHDNRATAIEVVAQQSIVELLAVEDIET